MKKAQAQAKLEKNGYSLVFTASGNVIATKGQRKFVSNSLNGLINQIF